MKKKISPLPSEKPLKEEAIYMRIDNSLLDKIHKIQKKKKHKNRSSTVRVILQWAFDNGVELA